ncbi:hypothetical protein [Clostridium kluyveri]|jgi:tetrahydromethanopterin S-methyltransferase subunit B|uniref:Uncharacterized protein n=2 Tax=Clostridium kluyveri TaxID=1534 RepID=A5N288_CLOK5|nr:hypothetical protein [Clostridium kluyveri]EDK33865.1 Hypothetical protein CKL_1823 [Clostridium kluyveri DSM 555]EDK35234.1 Hypothetical protein CKL_3231 [Clostridium kluyveri DSM 555]
MDYEKFLKDVKEGNAEDVKKDVEELQENLKELDTIGKLVDYLKTLDPNKKVLIGGNCMPIILRLCDIREKDNKVYLG